MAEKALTESVCEREKEGKEDVCLRADCMVMMQGGHGGVG